MAYEPLSALWRHRRTQLAEPRVKTHALLLHQRKSVGLHAKTHAESITGGRRRRGYELLGQTR